MQKIKEAITETVEKIRELNKTAMSELEKKSQNIKDIIANGVNGALKKTSQSIAEAVVLGKSLTETFRNMVNQLLVKMIAHFLEMSVRMLIDLDMQKQKDNLIRKQNTNLKRQIVLQMMLSAVGGGGGGGIPFMAKGGAVSKGNPIIVGENGAELFIPNSTGQITQSARGTGNGGSTTVNFNINTVDASGFEELLVRSRGAITQLINNAVNERGSKNLI